LEGRPKGHTSRGKEDGINTRRLFGGTEETDWFRHHGIDRPGIRGRKFNGDPTMRYFILNWAEVLKEE